MLRTIEQIKRRNRECGGHFFDRDTLRFFRSRIHGAVYPVSGARGGAFFVTSEQPPHGPRGYSVRLAYEDGRIDVIGPFCQLEYREAHRLAKRLSHSYWLCVHSHDQSAVEFARGRYAWADGLLDAVEYEFDRWLCIWSESEMWAYRAAVEADPGYLPCLDLRSSYLYKDLTTLLESVV